MTPILLRRDVHFRRAGDAFIFLDLRKDAYFSLDLEKSARLDALIADCASGAGARFNGADGFPQSGCDEVAGAWRARDDYVDLVGDLAAAGLIAGAETDGTPLRPAVISSPTAELFPGGVPEPVKTNLKNLSACLIACAAASAMLSSRSLAANVARVGRRRARRGVDVEISQTRRLISAFAIARAFYPRQKSCLFESLALIEFLAGAGAFPNWTFGVRSDPFGAHCWVETEGVVLNDGLETTRAFAPIFSA